MFWLQQSSERLITGLYIGETELGQLVALQQLGFAPVLLLATIGIRLLQPSWYNDSITELEAFYNTLRLIIIIIAVVGFACIYVVLLEGYMILAKSLEALNTSYAVLLLAGAAMASGEIMAAFYAKTRSYRSISAIKVVIGIIWIVCVWIGASILQFDGVIYGVLVGTSLYALSMVTLCIRRLRISLQ